MTKVMTEIKVMEDSGSWLLWPYLPLTSRPPVDHAIQRELAYLLAGHGPTVFIGNVLCPPAKPVEIEYESYEKILVDWKVD